MREILIDGPIQNENFFQNRAQFIHQTFGASLDYYKDNGENELKKIDSIPNNSQIYLWFEDDLFCQCNLWYCISRLNKNAIAPKIYLVRPDSDSWLGFGIMDSSQLNAAFDNSILLTVEQIKAFASIWEIYQRGEKNFPTGMEEKISEIIPRFKDVLQAHLDRLAPNNRPYSSLKSIIEESEDKSFPAVFKKFSKKEGIYGYGDSSIKGMYDEIMN